MKGGTRLNENDKLIKNLFNLIEGQLKGTDGNQSGLDQLKALLNDQGANDKRQKGNKRKKKKKD
jgi:hypothetical protein